jgi:hypothetical protein
VNVRKKPVLVGLKTAGVKEKPASGWMRA